MRTLLLLAATASLLPAQTATPEWHKEFPAFKITGDLYYVGTADLASYLVHTSDGLILINPGYQQDLPLLKKSIEKLGFHYKDVKVVLISNAHSEHDGSAGQVQRDTGAKVMAMIGDKSAEERREPDHPMAAYVDRELHDNDSVVLGGARLTAHLTPGKTPGCTTWTMRTIEGGKNLGVVIVGGPFVESGTLLVGNKTYPDIAEDYVRNFQTLRGLPGNVFLGAHGTYFNLKQKYAALKPGDPNPFIDQHGYDEFVNRAEQEFRDELQRQRLHPGSAKK
jgi:metallo-beta-lactamase class B